MHRPFRSLLALAVMTAAAFAIAAPPMAAAPATVASVPASSQPTIDAAAAAHQVSAGERFCIELAPQPMDAMRSPPAQDGLGLELAASAAAYKPAHAGYPDAAPPRRLIEPERVPIARPWPRLVASK